MMHGIEIVPDVLKEAVHARGGIDIVRSHRLWQKIRSDLHLKKSSSSGHTLNKAWVRCNEKNEKTFEISVFWMFGYLSSTSCNYRCSYF